MRPIDIILNKARNDPKWIVLPEGTDARVREGAAEAVRSKVARCILIGDRTELEEDPVFADLDPNWISFADPRTDSRLQDYAATYLELRRHKGMTPRNAETAMLDPIGFGAMMVRQGDADGSVAGAVATTADTVRAALQIIGPALGSKTISSFFLMILDKPHHGASSGAYIFSDCGLVIEPSEQELAEIALASALSYESLLDETARVAMLSFSTAGSARHDRVERVKSALEIARTTRPGLLIDGELQFDAAFVPDVGSKKAPNSPLNGRANVMIFPSLEAGNIGYKIAQRIGDATAVGPILQGLAKPANDLSRGCTAGDVYAAIAITAVQARAF